jgi:hypothetical protein
MMLRDYELRVSIKDLMEYINMRLASRWVFLAYLLTA